MKFSTNLEKLNYTYIFIIVSFLILVYFRSREAVSNWKYTHWLFNYEHEFVKRGLLGELLRILNVTPSYEIITLISLVLVFAVFLILSWIFFWPVIKSNNQLGLFIFCLVAITSPATLQSFNDDIGRFDGFGLIFMFVAMFAITIFPKIGSYLIAPIILILSLLIHEAFFFMFVPFVFGYWYWIDPNGRLVNKIMIFLIILFATYFISTHGIMEKIAYNEHLLSLQPLYGDRVSESSLRVIHQGSLSENIAWTMRDGITKWRAYEHVFMVIGLTPTFGLFFWLALKTSILRSFNRVILLCTAFSPLLLYPLGHDHFRWWSITLTNIFIFFSLMLCFEKEIREEINNIMIRLNWFAGFIIFFGLILGPLGITSSFHIPGLDFRYIIGRVFFYVRDFLPAMQFN